jgi:hypothetical protein
MLRQPKVEGSLPVGLAAAGVAVPPTRSTSPARAAATVSRPAARQARFFNSVVRTYKHAYDVCVPALYRAVGFILGLNSVVLCLLP